MDVGGLDNESLSFLASDLTPTPPGLWALYSVVFSTEPRGKAKVWTPGVP